MSYACNVLADSISPGGVRLTTLEITYPYIVHGEVMTHRDRARNAASNRGIPSKRFRAAVMEHPFIPIYWGRNQKGMQVGEELSLDEKAKAVRIWLNARRRAVKYAEMLDQLDVHKSISNRLMMPFQWITLIMTATEWGNFYNLRIAEDTEKHFERIAEMMWRAQQESAPRELTFGEWHLPLIVDQDRDHYPWQLLCQISAGRCARVSYLTHHGERNPGEDIRLCGDLIRNGHWSPLEHQAAPADPNTWSGPFRGWTQYRKQFASETRLLYRGER